MSSFEVAGNNVPQYLDAVFQKQRPNEPCYFTVNVYFYSVIIVVIFQIFDLLTHQYLLAIFFVVEVFVIGSF